MRYRGKVINGVVVVEGAALPENAEVQVEILDVDKNSDSPTWAEVLGDVIGSVDDMPADMAKNHDHYINGATKK